MENNLTATMNNHILYGGFDQWHTMYKTKLVIPSTQTTGGPISERPIYFEYLTFKNNKIIQKILAVYVKLYLTC